MGRRPFDASRDLRTEYRGTNATGKTVTCVPCGQIAFELPHDPTARGRALEDLGLAAHLELAHDVIGCRLKCSDPGCDLSHVVPSEELMAGPHHAVEGSKTEG